MRKKEMKKLYEILVKYDDGETDLISLKFTEIEKKISQITKGGKSGKLFVIEIDTHKGTTVIINDDSAQTIDIWPNTSDKIDGGAADAVDSNSLAAGASRRYITVDAENWYTA